MQINMDQFRNAFFEEAEEHLASMEAGLLQLESTPHDLELLHAIFRGAHSIKGGSGMFGFAEIIRFTHVMESLLDLMRDGKISAASKLTDLLLRATDILRTLVTIAKEGGEPPPALEDTFQELQQALNAETNSFFLVKKGAEEASPPAPQGVTQSYHLTFKPSRDLFRQGMDPLLLLRELAALGEVLEVRADCSQLPDLTHLDPESCYLAWSLTVHTDKGEQDLREVFAFVEDSSEIRIEQGAGSGEPEAVEGQQEEKRSGIGSEPATVSPSSPAPRPLTPDPVVVGRSSGAESASIRVPTEKVDKLINLVGELVITQSMISQTLEHFSLAKLNQLRESITELERNTRELQERVMAVRMMPIGNSFSRFPRLVRDLATQLNKKIAVQMIGEETELDKGMIERISDPLTHLVRNAADHGIESPEERRAAGKPEQGTIRLQAYHQGGNVIIEVGDEGRGLNVERIKQKALAQGLINLEDNLSDEQLHALIFHPGFSTAAVVSDVSGRGVGMDVVKKNIEALNGSVTVVSELGKGSCLRIKLPLTLAIIDGLSVKVGDDIYILPLVSIVESIRPRPEQVKRLFGRGEVIAVRGEFLPLIRLYHLFNTPTHIIDPSKGLVVIVETEGKKSGILVDELLGQAQVVIKNLEANYQKVEGVVGATILGDGRVALILDVQGLIHLAVQGSGGMSLALFEEEPMLEEGARVSLMNAEMSEASV